MANKKSSVITAQARAEFDGGSQIIFVCLVNKEKNHGHLFNVMIKINDIGGIFGQLYVVDDLEKLINGIWKDSDENDFFESLVINGNEDDYDYYEDNDRDVFH